MDEFTNQIIKFYTVLTRSLEGWDVFLEKEGMLGYNEPGVGPSKGCIFGPGDEEVRVVAHLLELHKNVHHPHHLIVLFILVRNELIIQVLLPSAEGASDDNLCFFRQLLLHILLESSKEERAEDSVELPQDLLADWIVLLQCFLQGQVEPFVEVIERNEEFGHQEVEQRPELADIVLERSPCQQQPAFAVEVEEDLPPLGFVVFDVLCLVQYHVIPLLAFEDGLVSHYNLITSNADMERVEFGPPFPFHLPFSGSPIVCHDFKGRAPSLKLYLPVHDDASWHYHQMGAPNPFVESQMGQKRDCLDSFPQPHLISQYPIHLFVVQGIDPVHPQKLILSQRVFNQKRLADNSILLYPNHLQWIQLQYQNNGGHHNIRYLEVLQLHFTVPFDHLAYLVGCFQLPLNQLLQSLGLHLLLLFLPLLGFQELPHSSHTPPVILLDCSPQTCGYSFHLLLLFFLLLEQYQIYFTMTQLRVSCYLLSQFEALLPLLHTIWGNLGNVLQQMIPRCQLYFRRIFYLPHEDPELLLQFPQLVLLCQLLLEMCLVFLWVEYLSLLYFFWRSHGLQVFDDVFSVQFLNGSLLFFEIGWLLWFILFFFLRFLVSFIPPANLLFVVLRQFLELLSCASDSQVLLPALE